MLTSFDIRVSFVRRASLSLCLLALVAAAGCQKRDAAAPPAGTAVAGASATGGSDSGDLAGWEAEYRAEPGSPDATSTEPSVPPPAEAPASAPASTPAPAATTQLAQAEAPPAAPAGPEPAAGAPLENTIGMKFAYVPSGEFTMGSPLGEPLRSEEEIAHKVKLSRGFYLGVYEVTQTQYAAVMDDTHFHFGPKGEDKKLVEGLDVRQFPAEGVSWEDAVEFCKRLNHNPQEEQAGRKYRLPTEAEWEYACRAGTTTATAFGDEFSSDQANFAGTHPYNGAMQGPRLHRPTTVGSYKPNAWGLYDMHGNVWEWCYDIYNSRFYEESPPADPSGPAKGVLVVAQRVLRGGSWDEMGQECRSAYRTGISPFHRGKHYGFRVHCVVK